MPNCPLCDRTDEIKAEKNPQFVAELETGYVVLGVYQLFRGYCIFHSKEHVSELHHLTETDKQQFLVEMSWVAEAIYNGFKPKKMNYEMLGNEVPHLHWHLFPRHADDPSPKKPVWQIDLSITQSESVKLTDLQRISYKQIILSELKKIKGAHIIREGRD